MAVVNVVWRDSAWPVVLLLVVLVGIGIALLSELLPPAPPAAVKLGGAVSPDTRLRWTLPADPRIANVAIFRRRQGATADDIDAVSVVVANALHRADTSSAHIRVRTTSGCIDIEVTDDGQADDAAMNGSPGLQGMAERTEALGGRLEVGPRNDGGWRVHAVLPLGSARGSHRRD